MIPESEVERIIGGKAEAKRLELLFMLVSALQTRGKTLRGKFST